MSLRTTAVEMFEQVCGHEAGPQCTWDLRPITDPMESWGWLTVPLECACGEPDCVGDTFEVVPKWDIGVHVAGAGTPMCSCNPRLDEGLIVHNSWDGREAFETGERKVS